MQKRKPDWLKVKIGGQGRFRHVRDVLDRRNLTTVCEHARCPNKAECWGCATATFMILGGTCTRNCGFCAVKSAKEGETVDTEEPDNLAKAASDLGLKYVVVTSVDRDDLPDRGSKHYGRCIKSLKDCGFKVEVLIPDYSREELEAVVKEKPDVIAHNIEVVERLQNIRDERASYNASLQTLLEVKRLDPGIKTKSSILLGLGEKRLEVLKSMDDLRAVGADYLVLGQYLQPTRKQMQVAEYVHPDTFTEYGKIGREKGFKKVVSEPLARTSYKAGEID